MRRAIEAAPRRVFEAWTQPELFRQWWVPQSCPFTLLGCDQDVRVGGRYRLAFDVGADQPLECFGTYTDVTPNLRLAWTNEEESAAEQVTTVTFEENDGGTLLVMHDLYPSKEALDEAIASGSTSGATESLDQLNEFLVSTGA